MDNKLRVAAYCRVSTDKDNQMNSLSSQRFYFNEFISRHQGWNLCGIYYDEGISGTQMAHRQGFLNMIQDAVSGRIDLILTKEVSRFARNTVDALAVTRQLKASGVGVIFTIDNIDTRDSDGELRLTIMASMAQEESRKISERVKWGQRRRMEQGVVFGRSPVGYTVKGGKMYINEQEASVIRSVFHKYTNEGKGTSVIARELLEEGMHPVSVKNWTNVMILKILRNEKYVGDLCQKKTFTPDYLTHAKKYNHGEEETVYLRNHHEPIIDRALWERTQKELKQRSPDAAEKAKHNNRYWYSGRLYCGICGSRFVTRTKKRKDGSVYKSFRCGKAAKEGHQKQTEKGKISGCSNHYISEEALLACLNFAVRQMQIDYGRIKKEILEEIRNLQPALAGSDEAEKAGKEIALLEEKKKKAVDFMLNGVLTEEELIRQKSWYDEKIEDLKKKIKKTRHSESSKDVQTDDENTGACGALQRLHGNTTKIYKQELDEIVMLNLGKEWVCKEVLDKIVIYEDESMGIWMKGLPSFIHIYYRTYGRRESYTTEIVKLEMGDDSVSQRKS